MFSSSQEPGILDFRSVYEHNSAMLLKIALRITGSVDAAEDVVQDAFAKYVEKDMRFPSSADAKYWLIRVVKNAALNYAKRKGREARAYSKWWRSEASPVEDVEAGAFPIEGTGAEAGVHPASDQEVLRNESARELREALERLPEKLKTVLVLKEYSGMSYKEIAGLMKITEGNVKVRAFRAREALLAMLKENEQDVS